MISIQTPLSLLQLSKLSKQRPLLIFGAGAVGELLAKIFQENDIQVSNYIDNNSGYANTMRHGLLVIQPDTAFQRFKDSIIVISAADIQDISLQLSRIGFTDIVAGGQYLRDVNFSNYKLSATTEFIEYTATTCILCHDAYMNPESIFLRSVDIVITERCSLKCKDCSNLMQYYENPKNIDHQEIESSLKTLCASVDTINEFRLIGGEPFMNKDIDKTLNLLINEPKARKILIYTNGTIIPHPRLTPLLSNPKVLMLVTDYNHLSPRMGKLIEFMENHKISYYRRPAENWTDCAKIEKHNRTIEGQKQTFSECCCKNLFTLMSGKLFRCPFSANADRLSAIPDIPDDYVDMSATRSLEEVKNGLRTLIYEKETLGACDFCDGRPLNAPHITPAIQTKHPLQYHKYTSMEITNPADGEVMQKTV